MQRALARASAGLLRRETAAALAIAIVLLPSAALAATVSFRIDRTSPDPEARTFGGNGSLTFDGPIGDPAEIDDLSLSLSTIGEDFAGMPIVHAFAYDASDIVSVSGLARAGGGLTGSILFAGKEASGGEAFMDGLELDFGAGLASGFCFSSGSNEEQCIFGGGTSSFVEAELATAPIPLPGALPLLALALAGLGCLPGRRGARRVQADVPAADPDGSLPPARRAALAGPPVP